MAANALYFMPVVCRAEPLQDGAANTPVLATIPAATVVLVAMNADISSQTNQVGDAFEVSVSQDVKQDGSIAIPKGTFGTGVVTFVSKKGGFGKPGIIGIGLRTLKINGREFILDGRYREEGKNGNSATAATYFVVGILAAAVQGKGSVIPAGRILAARTGEAIPYLPGNGSKPAAQQHQP